MINTSKNTHFNQLPQIAGLMPNDFNIEFVGVRKTKQVIWLQNGNSHYFTDLPIQHYNLLQKAFKNDHKAVRFLKNVTDSPQRQVELYTYYLYGELDTTPDIKHNQLSTSENFRDKRNCPSLLWNSKNINIYNHILTPRQLVIIDLIGNDMPDKTIAVSLGISQTTLDFHKKKLFQAVGCQTKTGLLKKAYQHLIIK